MNQLALNSIIINPEGTTADYAVIWMHGLGASAHDFAQLPTELNLPAHINIRFIFPNAPLRAVTINNGLKMPAWFDIKSLTDLDNEDAQGISDSQAKIEQLIAQQIDQGIKAERIFLGGFSQGGAVALLTGLKYKKQLAGIISLSGYLPLAHSQDKNIYDENIRKLPIFWGHGTIDSVVPILLGEKSKSILEKLGYDVDWHTYPIAHQVSLQEIQDIQRWITKQIS
jgi:phospholipase/carboxylesterase